MGVSERDVNRFNYRDSYARFAYNSSAICVCEENADVHMGVRNCFIADNKALYDLDER